MKLRDTVKWFARQMEQKLRKHDNDRGTSGWVVADPQDLLDRVSQETDELQAALDRLGLFDEAHVLARHPSILHRVALTEAEIETRRLLVIAVIKEAADVSNMAMMVADVALRSDIGAKAVPAPRVPKERTILGEAADAVHGPRQHDYGHPSVNHGRTAAMWSAYFGIHISARDVCQANVLQKVSRDRNRAKRDNLVDEAGWAENAQMCEDAAKADLPSHR